MINIVEVNKIHKEGHFALANKSGGEIRGARGLLVENLVADCWESLGPEYKVVSQGKHAISFKGNKLMEIGCDVDCYKNEELVCIVECKSYLDKPYLERAMTDFGYLEEVTKVPKIVVTLENAINKNTYEFIVHRNQDINFNGMYTLCLGKRSAEKPIYIQEYFKYIDEELFKNLMDFFKRL